MIHIVNGDVVGKRLNVEGEVIIWREMYDWGPLSHEWGITDFIGRRAAFFEEKIELPSSIFIKNSKSQLETLQQIQAQEEVVLWFEHDFYDQTMLMYVLNELQNRGANLFMVTLDSHPEVEPFLGMGQLSSEQLTELEKTKKRVTPEQVQEAVEGWRAYTSAHLSTTEKWIRESPHPLPYLKDAMIAHLDSIPCSDKGLSYVEEWVLNDLKGQMRPFYELLSSLQSQRRYDGLSDFRLSYILRQLGSLIEVEGSLPNFQEPEQNPCLTLSENGKHVLNGKVRRMDLIGLDTWVGGARLFRCKQPVEETQHVDQ